MANSSARGAGGEITGPSVTVAGAVDAGIVVGGALVVGRVIWLDGWRADVVGTPPEGNDVGPDDDGDDLGAVGGGGESAGTGTVVESGTLEGSVLGSWAGAGGLPRRTWTSACTRSLR